MTISRTVDVRLCSEDVCTRASAIPYYSGKLSLVQTFAELLVNPNFHQVHDLSPCVRTYVTYSIQNYVVLIFEVADLSAKNMKVCTMRKFPAVRYLLPVAVDTAWRGRSVK